MSDSLSATGNPAIRLSLRPDDGVASAPTLEFPPIFGVREREAHRALGALLGSG